MRGINVGRKKEWIKNNCFNCNGEFEVQPSNLWIKFCSKDCRIKNQMGKPTWNKGLKGFRAGEKRIAYFKGGKHTEEAKKKISISHMGEKNFHWNPNREAVKKNERNDGAYLQWAKEVKKRDQGVCRLQNENCMGYKVVHHILRWADYPEERYNINNGITLCQYHHPRKRVDENKLIPTLQELIGLKK